MLSIMTCPPIIECILNTPPVRAFPYIPLDWLTHAPLSQILLPVKRSRATEKQRKVLEVNYGKHDAKKIENVKNLFVEMELEKAFKTYEEESYAEIQV